MPRKSDMSTPGEPARAGGAARRRLVVAGLTLLALGGLMLGWRQIELRDENTVSTESKTESEVALAPALEPEEPADTSQRTPMLGHGMGPGIANANVAIGLDVAPSSTPTESSTAATDQMTQPDRAGPHSVGESSPSVESRAVMQDRLATALSSQIHVPDYGWLPLHAGVAVLEPSRPHLSTFHDAAGIHLIASPGRFAIGDLNGDGIEDVAQIFKESFGIFGVVSRSSISLNSDATAARSVAVFLSHDDGARFAGTVVEPLWDIEDLRVEDGELVIVGADARVDPQRPRATPDRSDRVLSDSQGRPRPPSYRRLLRYRLGAQDGEIPGPLELVGDEDLGDIEGSAPIKWMQIEPHLAETAWRWAPSAVDLCVHGDQPTEARLFVDALGRLRLQLGCGTATGWLRSTPEIFRLYLVPDTGCQSTADAEWLARLATATGLQEREGSLWWSVPGGPPLRFESIPYEWVPPTLPQGSFGHP